VENILYILKIHILNSDKKIDLKITTIEEKHLIFQKKKYIYNFKVLRLL